MRGTMWVLSVMVMLAVLVGRSVAAQPVPSCEENLRVVSVQAQEYYADRDAKQKEKIMLRAQLNDAQAQIQALKAEVAELKKPKEPAK